MAIAKNPLEAFVWGEGGAALTPEEIASRRKVEAALLGKIDTSPVGHWTQGLARVADAIAGSVRRGRLDSAEEANVAYDADLRNSLLGGAAPASPASAAVPATIGAGEEMAATSPAVKPVDISADQQTFVQSLLPAAIEEGKRTGVDPRIIVAQAAQETGWGRSAPGNNYFGIKSHGQGGGNSLMTTEYVAGQPVKMRDSFRGYGSPAESVRGYGDFILQNPRYEKLRTAQGLDAQLEALQASGYATDPNYARSVGAIARGIQLPQEVAAATPQAAIEAVAPSSGYVDPMVNAQGPVEMASLPPQAAQAEAPALPPPTTIAPPPAVAVAPQQQVAQAMTAPPPAASPALNPAIVRALTDPRASPGTRAVAQALMQQEQAKARAAQEQQMWMARQQYEQAQKANDPNFKLAQEKFAFEKDQSARTSDIKEYEYAKGQGFTGSFAEFQQSMKKAGAANTTINTGEGSKFYNKLDEKNAETFSTLSEEGLRGRGKLAQIDRLESLMANAPQGAIGVLKQAAGEYGIKTEGLSDIQAASALINELVPQQRQPGSGTMSDADLALFKQSLPRIINQPGGNQLIFQTMRGISQYQIKMGEIADAVANRDLTPQQGRDAIQKLENPLAKFKPPAGEATPNEGWQELAPGVRVRKVN